MLDSIIIGAEVTLDGFLICTAASLLLGLGIALLSMYRSSYTQSFVITLAMLPAVVQVIILLVNGNIGAGALDYASAGEYDAIILDIMMPKLDGLAVLTRLRAAGVDTPVMLLTARGEKDDRVTGFNAGADDYLPKPFAPDELLARVRAMLRRAGDYKPPVLRFGDLELDCGSSTLRCGEQLQRLSGREFQVLELFMRSPQVILSAERIMERVWGWDTEAEINVVWVHISNLRKKLSTAGSTVTIRASRGLGYSLEDAG